MTVMASRRCAATAVVAFAFVMLAYACCHRVATTTLATTWHTSLQSRLDAYNRRVGYARTEQR